MNELKQILENYTMGFITPNEFISQYADVLARVGAERCLVDARNKLLLPLANHLVSIIDGSGKSIEDFEYLNR